MNLITNRVVGDEDPQASQPSSHSSPTMSVSTINTQGLVPGLAAQIRVVHLNHRNCRILRDALDVGSANKVYGVSFRLSKRGAIEALALATPTTVFFVSLNEAGTQQSFHKGANAASKHAKLRDVLEDPRCLLAGVGIARTVLLLHRNTGAHVRGVELLALPAESRGKQTSPADLASTYLSPTTSHRRIHALWLRASNDDICRKAWLLAWYGVIVRYVLFLTLTPARFQHRRERC